MALIKALVILKKKWFLFRLDDTGKPIAAHDGYASQTRYDHKCPPRPIRDQDSVYFVLMRTSTGFATLHNHNYDYMSLQSEKKVDDVEKGTLVRIDPECDFDPEINISVNVITISPVRDVRVTALYKVGQR